VKSRRADSGRKSQSAYILTVLAEKLSDRILQEYFRDHSPKQVRKILAETAALFAPDSEQVSLLPRSQGTLWSEEKKAWFGKLAGKTLQLYSDGASRGNPGKAGAGVVILDDKNNELVGSSYYLGQCTNNEAEYRALLYGLEKCREFGRGSLKVHLDSELVVKQINGEYKVKHPNLKKLYQQVTQKLTDFAAFHMVHVRREKNTRADELANRAIDEHLQ